MRLAHLFAPPVPGSPLFFVGDKDTTFPGKALYHAFAKDIPTIYAAPCPARLPLKHTYPCQNPLWGTMLCFNHPYGIPLKHTHPCQNPLWGTMLCFNHLHGTPLKHTYPVHNLL